MRPVPVFIEVVHSAEHANIQLCQKIMAQLFKHKIAPLPYAANLVELTKILKSLRERGMVPGIFIINTFWAEELIEELDVFLRQTPVLFLNRRIFGKETQILSNGAARECKQRIAVILEKMNLPNSTVMTYGSNTSDELASQTAQALITFLNDGNFNHIRQGQHSHADFNAALHADPETIQRMLHDGMLNSISPATLAPPAAELPAWLIAAAEPSTPAPVESTTPLPTAPLTAPIKSVAPPVTPPAAPPITPAASPILSPRNNPRLSGLHGAISQLDVPTLVSRLDMEKKTGVLSLTTGDVTARFYFRQGRIVKACIQGLSPAGEATAGSETVYQVLRWRDGLFKFRTLEINEPDEINLPTSSLLSEAARRMNDSVA